MTDQEWEELFDKYITEVVDDEQEHIKSHELPTAIKIRGLVSDLDTQAAANKAAEEGGLPFAELSINQKRALSEGLSALEVMADIWSAEIRLSEMAQRIADAPAEQRPGTIAAMIEQAFIEGAYRHFLDHKDAADRASRQVANKAEGEPVAYMSADKKMLVFEDAMDVLKFDRSGMTALYATPPATTGASTVLTDEQTSINSKEFQKILDDFYGTASVQGSTKQEERDLIAHINQHVAREVAAQAGQVAVPGWKLVPEKPTEAMINAFYGPLASVAVSYFDWDDGGDEAYAAMLDAAPSPARESK